ncbi:MAG: AAA family ATPase, partial [Deltaproteobacteria bacterium]|nr:AAA family ATPase [Deltaproteobacteria bacterium]
GPAADPLQLPAIVLIDEVDLHLHPRWQQRVLNDLRRTFPQTQFIVTTHSPQVITTVPEKSIRIIDKGAIFASPPGSEGAEASRMLKRVFGVEQRPPNNSVTQDLSEYLDLVHADKWDSERAQELRERLDQQFQGEEPALQEADLYIENRKWELGG